MGNFSIPVKQVIVNADSQMDVINNVNGVTPTIGDFTLSGFLSQTNSSQLELLAAAVRIRVVAPVVAAAEVATFTFTLGAADGDVVIVRETSLDLTPTESQNQPVDKRYQLPLAAAATNTGDAITAAINADPHAKVTASNVAGVVTLTAKETGATFDMYTGEGNVTLIELPAKNATTPATLGIGIYDTLKNIEFSKNIEEDRNQEYYPKKGSTYNQYYFEVNWSTVDLGGHDVPSLLPAAGKTAFQIWALVGGTVDTDLAALGVLVNK